MLINCIDKKNYQLTNNGLLLGEVIYKSMFSRDAQLKLVNTDTYDVKKEDFWGKTILITNRDTEFARFKMNWKGEILINFRNGDEYRFKSKGFLKPKYSIENKFSEIVLQFTQNYNWSKFRNDIAITINTKPDDILFILIGIYILNYHNSMMAAHAAV
jgi:hypothetical protein